MSGDFPVRHPVMNILIPMFKNELQYKNFKDIADDKDHLCDNLIEYEQNAQELIIRLEKSGEKIYRSEINVVDMVSWLKMHNHSNVGKYRSIYYAELVKSFFNLQN
jgi:hypothetical protein